MMLPIRGDPVYALVRNLKAFFKKCCSPLFLATLSAIFFFVAHVDFSGTHTASVTRHLVYTTVFFTCIWVACRLFIVGIDRRLLLEDVTRQTAGTMIYTFVIYLEIIKHVVGVSFSLAWIAGILACWEYLGEGHLIVPLSASFLVSLTTFTIMYCFSNLLDQLRWPDKYDS